ncbi:hypothetical protein [Streptomyces sp. OR43]|uniref:hypothetical protein n=1 Tax=Streptomyces sp. or43 TaxID=2478957 RepID=UPI0011CEB2BF|nr:hypothetical protein [Streptomyces sp. or43]TXS34932.1 hypothetical protein EAO72_40380 [Streptomyces sp. or43]
MADQLLERLIKRVNLTGTFFDITIIVGGAMITGRIAPRVQWLDGNITHLQGIDLAEFADDFAQEGAALDHEDYLLLSQARYVHDTNMLPPHGAAFRVRLSEVQGWMLGRLAKSPRA